MKHLVPESALVMDVLKSNTVLVSKSLAKAQFRCWECQKVFISCGHLEKHTLRRHRGSLFNVHTAPIQAGQPDVLNHNDQKLIEVTGRLENVLSLLETKVDLRPSTAWVGSPSPDNLSPILNGDCKNIYVLPAAVSDIRRPVNLFTLPQDKRLHLETENFGPEDAEFEVDEQIHKVSDEEDTVELIKEFEVDQDANSDNYTKNPIDAGVSPLPSPIRPEHVDAAGNLGPLIVDLINKLEKVSIEPKYITSSCCQTDAQEAAAVTNGRQPSNSWKPERFSDLPLDENHKHPLCFDSKNDEEGQYGANSTAEDDVAGDDESQSFANSMESKKSSEESDLEGPGGFAFEIPCDQSVDQIKIEPDHIVESSKANNCDNFYLETIEDSPTAVQPAVSSKNIGKNVEFSSKNDGEFETLTILRSQKPEEFTKTKQQILNLVEKCIQGLNRDNLKPKKSGDDVIDAEKEGKIDLKNVSSKEVVIDKCDVDAVDSVIPKYRDVICVKYDTTFSIPGLLAPSNIICKDGGVDIDDMSGDSYEQFMKRLSSSFDGNRKEVDEREHIYEQVEGEIPYMATNPSAIDESPVNKINLHQAPVEIVPQAQSVANYKSADLKLNKTEYAVLLHHETTQVQNLIDTLVMDLQRWKDAKKNDLSKAVRVQLEERLACNMNLLGIHNTTKTLLDGEMSTAKHLLNNKRLKTVKEHKLTYFDKLKAAFAKEIDRIAKSRTEYPF